MQEHVKPLGVKELPSLTGLRFTAALFVFITHGLKNLVPMNGVAPNWYSFLDGLAMEGMSLFFVLSGFVIHYRYSHVLQNNLAQGLYHFFVARFARLYPLFILCLLFDITHLYGYSQLTATFSSVIPYYLTLTQSWFYTPFGNNALIYQFGPSSQVSWSVSTECFFYLVYPFISFFLAKRSRVQTKVLLGVVFFTIWFCLIIGLLFYKGTINHYASSFFGPIADEQHGMQDAFFQWLLYFSPYVRLGEFLLGCMMAAIYMQLSSLPVSRKEAKVGRVLMIGSLIGIVFFHYILMPHPQEWLISIPILRWVRQFSGYFYFVPFIAIFLFACARYDNAMSRFFAHPLLVAGGEASYALYLLHTVVIVAFSRDAAPVSISTSWIVYLADFSRLLFTFIVAMGTAMLLYRCVELPARRFLRHYLLMKTRKFTYTQPTMNAK